MTITADAAALCTVNFTPVTVRRGRKFKGFGYKVSAYDSSFYVFPGRGGLIESYTAEIWNPSTKQIVKANEDFCEKTEVCAETIAEAKREYIEITLNGTIEWCRSTKPNMDENEINRFARNVVKKQHPEMLPAFDANVVIVDNRDVVVEIQRTVQWALSLRTRPCRIYGKWCAGGKQYSPRHTVDVAYKALCKRAVDKLDGFDEIFNMVLDLHSLPHRKI